MVRSMLMLMIIFSFFFLSHSTIHINSPLVTPFPSNDIPYFYVNFGSINYEKSQNFDLVILNNSLCKDQNVKLGSGTFVVVEEDFSQNCSSTRQAMIAQHLGAKGIIISSQFAQLEEAQIILIDDGNGRRVHIACLLISSDTLSQLKGMKSSKIQITANFIVPKAKISKITFFLSASQRISYLFLKHFNEDYPDLANKLELDAVYYTFESEWANQNNCYSSQYCTYDYENYEVGVGQKIIHEQLMQYNILKVGGQGSWLLYMSKFDEVCNYNWLQIEQCDSLVFKATGIKQMIELSVDPMNTMRIWRQKQKQFAFDTFPEVAINGMIFRGNLDYNSFFEAVCDSLLDPPPKCYLSQQNTSDPKGRSNSTSPLKLMLVFSFTICFILVSAFWLYRKCVVRETTAETTGRVNELVANYANQISERHKKRRSREHEELHQQL